MVQVPQSKFDQRANPNKRGSIVKFGWISMDQSLMIICTSDPKAGRVGTPHMYIVLVYVVPSIVEQRHHHLTFNLCSNFLQQIT